nr:MAG TPA: hypothetical protein [Caudoviricetes sp.]
MKNFRMRRLWHVSQLSAQTTAFLQNHSGTQQCRL